MCGKHVCQLPSAFNRTHAQTQTHSRIRLINISIKQIKCGSLSRSQHNSKFEYRLLTIQRIQWSGWSNRCAQPFDTAPKRAPKCFHKLCRIITINSIAWTYAYSNDTHQKHCELCILKIKENTINPHQIFIQYCAKQMFSVLFFLDFDSDRWKLIALSPSLDVVWILNLLWKVEAEASLFFCGTFCQNLSHCHSFAQQLHIIN